MIEYRLHLSVDFGQLMRFRHIAKSSIDLTDAIQKFYKNLVLVYCLLIYLWKFISELVFFVVCILLQNNKINSSVTSKKTRMIQIFSDNCSCLFWMLLAIFLTNVLLLYRAKFRDKWTCHCLSICDVTNENTSVIFWFLNSLNTTCSHLLLAEIADKTFWKQKCLQKPKNFYKFVFWGRGEMAYFNIFLWF